MWPASIRLSRSCNAPLCWHKLVRQLQQPRTQLTAISWLWPQLRLLLLPRWNSACSDMQTAAAGMVGHSKCMFLALWPCVMSDQVRPMQCWQERSVHAASQQVFEAVNARLLFACWLLATGWLLPGSKTLLLLLLPLSCFPSSSSSFSCIPVFFFFRHKQYSFWGINIVNAYAVYLNSTAWIAVRQVQTHVESWVRWGGVDCCHTQLQMHVESWWGGCVWSYVY